MTTKSETAYSSHNEKLRRTFQGPEDFFSRHFTKIKGRTPLFVYNLDHVRHRLQILKSALAQDLKTRTRIHYAVKANPNRRLLQTLAHDGAFVDVVSMGEAERALESGFQSSQVLFSGVAKTRRELEWAILNSIDQINVESEPELARIIEISRTLNRPVQIGFRLNPNVCPETHPYITTGLKENKFGLEADEIRSALKTMKSVAHDGLVQVRGLSIHIGSQILDLSATREALEIAADLQNELARDGNWPMDRFDAGGGLGIQYQSEDETQETALATQLAQTLAEVLEKGPSRIQSLSELMIEPGRWLVARSGILVTEVQYVKKNPYKTFVIVDAGMNALMRPALYQAQHRILPIASTDSSDSKQTAEVTSATESRFVCDVVGPICESADFLARDREIQRVAEGDLLAVMDAGAYGYSMASLYNLRGWPEETTIENGDLK